MCVLAISFGGCLEDTVDDAVQITNSAESTFSIVVTTAEQTEDTDMLATTTEVTTETTTKLTTATKSTTTTTTTTTSKTKKTSTTGAQSAQTSYVLNTNSMKFHRVSCAHAKKIKAENRQDFTGGRQQVIDMGYSACGTCKP